MAFNFTNCLSVYIRRPCKLCALDKFTLTITRSRSASHHQRHRHCVAAPRRLARSIHLDCREGIHPASARHTAHPRSPPTLAQRTHPSTLHTLPHCTHPASTLSTTRTANITNNYALYALETLIFFGSVASVETFSYQTGWFVDACFPANGLKAMR